MFDSDIEALIGSMFGLFGCLMMVAVVVFAVLIYWRIFSKSGHPGALGLLMFIPLVNLILLIWFAFSEWPIQREVADLRRRLETQQTQLAQRQQQPPAPPTDF